jgi:hypothetical protein
MCEGHSCGIGPSLGGRRVQSRANAENGGNASAPQGRRGGSKGVGTNPECAPESTDCILTTLTRIRIGTAKTSIRRQFWTYGIALAALSLKKARALSEVAREGLAPSHKLAHLGWRAPSGVPFQHPLRASQTLRSAPAGLFTPSKEGEGILRSCAGGLTQGSPLPLEAPIAVGSESRTEPKALAAAAIFRTTVG